MMQDNVPAQPLFAPSSGQNGQAVSEDIDLNEIFAEYFVNELDNDPLNAYTSSMANYRPQTDEQQIRLPVGGIKTPFHAATATANATAPGTAVAPAPAEKKLKTEATTASGVPIPPGLSPNPSLLNNVAHLPHPGMLLPTQQPVGVLPVGHGIRFGPSGIAPETAKASLPSRSLALWPTGTGTMSEQAIAERRQRNREHAKRSRVRKKFMLESLQEEVRGLQKENQRLRMLVQEHIPGNGMKIISECCQDSRLFKDGDMGEQTGGPKPSGPLERSDQNLMTSLSSGQQCFVLSDPKLPDNPIVYASPGFYQLTGYSSKEVLGRNCRFLQGPGTDDKAVKVIKKAIETGSDATVCILNYKSDGTAFWNQFFVAALRDSDNCIVNYVGVQCEVEADAGQTALEDRVNAVLPLQSKDGEMEGEGGP